jgi:hypothetical protein
MACGQYCKTCPLPAAGPLIYGRFRLALHGDGSTCGYPAGEKHERKGRAKLAKECGAEFEAMCHDIGVGTISFVTLIIEPAAVHVGAQRPAFFFRIASDPDSAHPRILGNTRATTPLCAGFVQARSASLAPLGRSATIGFGRLIEAQSSSAEA